MEGGPAGSWECPRPRRCPTPMHGRGSRQDAAHQCNDAATVRGGGQEARQLDRSESLEPRRRVMVRAQWHVPPGDSTGLPARTNHQPSIVVSWAGWSNERGRQRNQISPPFIAPSLTRRKETFLARTCWVWESNAGPDRRADGTKRYQTRDSMAL